MSDIDQFAQSVRSLVGRVSPTDVWRPGLHVDDRSVELTAGLTTLGWDDLGAGDADTHPFLSIGALELGRNATTPFDVVQLLGGSPVVGSLAMYAEPGQRVAIPARGGVQLHEVTASRQLPFADSLGVHRVLGQQPTEVAPAGTAQLAAWEAATVGYLAGLAVGVVDRAVEHASNRHIFGKTLAHIDAVQQRIADAATCADALVLTARAGGHGLPALAHASASVWQVMVHAHLIFGAIGFTMEFPLQRYSRRAKALGAFVDSWVDQTVDETDAA